MFQNSRNCWACEELFFFERIIMREKLNTLILIFTRFATSIFLIDSIVLLAVKGREAKLLATDILVILALALVCALLYLILLNDKNVSKTKMFLLQLLYFIIIDGLVLLVGNFLCWFSFHYIKSFFAFEGVIILVIFITVFYSYRCDSITAKKMNKKLQKLDENNN